MSGIAHEVKNPLNIIINAALLIKEFMANNHETLQEAFSANPKKLEELEDVQTMLSLIESSDVGVSGAAFGEISPSH